MEFLRRITIRNVGLKVSDVRALANKGEGAVVPLLRIAGYTTWAQEGQTDKGSFTRLLGEFQAVNLTDGTVYQSGQTILPSFIADQLAAALKVSTELEMALEIGCQADETAIAGFVYTARPLIEPAKDSRLAKLLERAGMVNLLPAPAAEEPEKGRAAK